MNEMSTRIEREWDEFRYVTLVEEHDWREFYRARQEKTTRKSGEEDAASRLTFLFRVEGFVCFG